MRLFSAFTAFLLIISLSFSADLFAQKDDACTKLVRQAVEAYKSVSDYTSILLRTERINGKLRIEEKISLKFREPCAIYMKWITSPNSGLLNEGTEVIYPVGKKGDKMIAHLGGLINLITPTVTVSPLDKMVMENNRHPVTHTGIGYILKLFVNEYDKASGDAAFAQIYHGVVDVLGRRTHKVEFVMPGREKGYYCYRAELYFDAENKMPIKIVAYDWNDEIIERYSFKDLTINTGLKDSDFDPRNREYNF